MQEYFSEYFLLFLLLLVSFAIGKIWGFCFLQISEKLRLHHGFLSSRLCGKNTFDAALPVPSYF